jgi:5-methylcytosine-specific restriction endonuclease McrA
MRKPNQTRPIRRCGNRWHPHVVSCSRQVGQKWNVAFGRGISAGLKNTILEHDELTCRMCGVAPGDIDDLTGREVTFHIGKISLKRLGGKDELSNLRVLCTSCYRGAYELLKKGTSDNRPLSQFLISLFGANRALEFLGRH